MRPNRCSDALSGKAVTEVGEKATCGSDAAKDREEEQVWHWLCSAFVCCCTIHRPAQITFSLLHLKLTTGCTIFFFAGSTSQASHLLRLAIYCGSCSRVMGRAKKISSSWA